MSRTTCGNEFIFVAAICTGLMVTSARGGDLDAPAGPESTDSAMWTLNDIYNVLDTRATNVVKRPGAFTEPGGGPTNGTMRSLNDIMTLVTNRSAVPKTGMTNMYSFGDDGTNRIGVAWPNPRFTVQSTNSFIHPDDRTNCVLDKLTGLIWTRNANLPGGTLDWTNAISYCTNMNKDGGTYGYTGWRLPNIRELKSLIDWQYFSPALSDGTGTQQWTEALGPFTGVKSDVYYWSSTYYSPLSGSQAWYVFFGYVGTAGYVMGNGAKTGTYYVWPVRGGQ